jgi:hypothetical protein
MRGGRTWAPAKAPAKQGKVARESLCTEQEKWMLSVHDCSCRDVCRCSPLTRDRGRVMGLREGRVEIPP